MKHRLLLISFLLLKILFAQANDTLTVRQVYSYNVGDTFDYKIAGWTFQLYIDTHPTTDTQYARCIITQKYTSINNDTLKYVRQWVYPTFRTENIVITQLDSPITWFEHHNIAISNSPPTWQLDTPFGVISNLILDSYSYHVEFNHSYSIGLGVNHVHIFNGMGHYSHVEDTLLIYYAQGNVQKGTPYYTIPNYYVHTSVNNIENDIKAILYPNPSTGTFTLQSEGLLHQSYTIYDLLGHTIVSDIITTNKQFISLPDVQDGVYILNVTGNPRPIRFTIVK